jgi:hypothetical protein
MRAGFMVTLYSYYFYVLIEEASADKRMKERMFKEFLKATPGAYRLSPGKEAVIYSSSLSMFEVSSRSGPLVRNILRWEEWKKQR